MQADLHVHSVYSDGLYSPDEICRLASRRGLSLISITDHDTLSGLSKKREAAKKYGLSYLSGWEVSAYENTLKVHVLGYGCKEQGAYECFVRTRKAASFVRAEESVQKFNALGIPLTMENVLSQRASAELPVHTMHIARAAAKYLGWKEGDVYREYLAVGKPANSNYGRPTPMEAIDCIHEAGGIAVIAHPGRLEVEDSGKEILIKRLAEYGADGIEAVYTTHTERETKYFCELAKALGILITGGSDTHYEDGVRAIGTPYFSPSKEFLEKVKISL